MGSHFTHAASPQDIFAGQDWPRFYDDFADISFLAGAMIFRLFIQNYFTSYRAHAAPAGARLPMTQCAKYRLSLVTQTKYQHISIADATPT